MPTVLFPKIQKKMLMLHLCVCVCVCVCVLISGQLYLIMALQGLGVGLFSTLSALQSVCFHTVQSSEEEEAGKYHPINQSSKRFLQRPSS